MNTVIFDLGNVLVNYDWETFLRTFQFDEATFHAVAHAMFLSDVWQKGDASFSIGRTSIVYRGSPSI